MEERNVGLGFKGVYCLGMIVIIYFRRVVYT
jgi:hypothetical protein